MYLSVRLPLWIIYFGQSSRNLLFCIREHLQRWLSKDVVKSVCGLIPDHLVQTGHGASVSQSFSIIYSISNFLSTSILIKVLQTVEVIAI